MPYGNKGQPTLRYSFGCKPPHEGMEVVRDQARRIHRYNNYVVAMHQRKFKHLEEDRIQQSDEFRQLKERQAFLWNHIVSLRSVIAEENSQNRKKQKKPRQAGEIKQSQAELKRVAAKLKSMRKSKQFADIEERHKEDLNAYDKWARDSLRVYWPSYNRVFRAVERAGVKAKFKRWSGGVHISCQIQKGMTVAAALACKSRWLRIERVDAKRSNVWIRVYSEGQDPVWAVVRTTFHRDLPSDARIKNVHLLCVRTGRDEKWQVQFDMARESGWAKQDCAKSGSVAVDVGWRKLPQGIRVAYWVGTDGDEGELLIPLSELSVKNEAERLHALRDKQFNEFRQWLVDTLKEEYQDNDAIQEEFRTLAQWRSPDRLSATIRRLRNGQVPERLAIRLEIWRSNDGLLLAQKTQIVRKMRHRRQHLYRNFAAKLRRKYRTVIVEDVRWDNIQRRNTIEQGPDSDAIHKYRAIAAVGELVRCCLDTFANPLKVDPRNTTYRCHCCGNLSGQEDRRQLHYTCKHCGEVYDRDRNAALNLLQAGCEDSSAVRKKPAIRKGLRRSKRDPSKSRPKDEAV